MIGSGGSIHCLMGEEQPLITNISANINEKKALLISRSFDTNFT
jgi:hypothetical protein